MKQWLQSLLSIDVILAHLHDIRNLRTEDNKRISAELNSMRLHAIASNRGMARLVTKFDPTYSQDELDSKRKAESDRIGDEVLKRLIAEHKASNAS